MFSFFALYCSQYFVLNDSKVTCCNSSCLTCFCTFWFVLLKKGYKGSEKTQRKQKNPKNRGKSLMASIKTTNFARLGEQLWSCSLSTPVFISKWYELPHTLYPTEGSKSSPVNPIDGQTKEKRCQRPKICSQKSRDNEIKVPGSWHYTTAVIKQDIHLSTAINTPAWVICNTYLMVSKLLLSVILSR